MVASIDPIASTEDRIWGRGILDLPGSFEPHRHQTPFRSPGQPTVMSERSNQSLEMAQQTNSLTNKDHTVILFLSMTVRYRSSDGKRDDDLYLLRCALNRKSMATQHRILSLLVYRRGLHRSLLLRHFCSSSMMDISGEALMLRGLKGKERRRRRALQLRKNRCDASLERKARTGRCKQSIQYL